MNSSPATFKPEKKSMVAQAELTLVQAQVADMPVSYLIRSEVPPAKPVASIVNRSKR
ncbi:hypothetical protein [Bythopirellula polymerisocia]|uniref:hypothetical protein n=1 Tax=Bythopirellula polymerisocia TaxID=2528003 RepID=UPI0018D34075|nr:hypothetical protein [Bythopirellula polymerisocia]